MKMDDLFTTLHDQYNTFSFTIQEPEAFYRDVYEASRDADSVDDLHRLLADRRQQRLDELHGSFKSLAVEIIANPKLMASDQWQCALRLFRAKSFDSVVRFFASYLPHGYFDHDAWPSDSHSDTTSEVGSVDTQSTKTSSVEYAASYSSFSSQDFLSYHAVAGQGPSAVDGQGLAQDTRDGLLEPGLPLAEDRGSSATHTRDDESESPSLTAPSSRSMSFSCSEPDWESRLNECPFAPDDKTCLSLRDGSNVWPLHGLHGSKGPCYPGDLNDHQHASGVLGDLDESFSTTQFPEDDFDFLDNSNDTLHSESPTPRRCCGSINMAVTTSICAPPRRSCSPASHPPLPRSVKALRKDDGLPTSIRRSPDEVRSKVCKSASELTRKRTSGRMRSDL